MQIGSVVVNSRARSDEIRMIFHRIEARNQADNHCTRSNTKFAPKLDSGAPNGRNFSMSSGFGPYIHLFWFVAERSMEADAGLRI